MEVVALLDLGRREAPAPQVVYVVAVEVVIVVVVIVIVVIIAAVDDVDDVHDGADGDGGERHELERGYRGRCWCLRGTVCKISIMLFPSSNSSFVNTLIADLILDCIKVALLGNRAWPSLQGPLTL